MRALKSTQRRHNIHQIEWNRMEEQWSCCSRCQSTTWIVLIVRMCIEIVCAVNCGCSKLRRWRGISRNKHIGQQRENHKTEATITQCRWLGILLMPAFHIGYSLTTWWLRSLCDMYAVFFMWRKDIINPLKINWNASHRKWDYKINVDVDYSAIGIACNAWEGHCVRAQ